MRFTAKIVKLSRKFYIHTVLFYSNTEINSNFNSVNSVYFLIVLRATLQKVIITIVIVDEKELNLKETLLYYRKFYFPPRSLQ